MTTLAVIALGVGTGLQVAGQIQQGKIAEAQGKLDKQIAARNQQALNRQGAAERDAAEIESKRIARQEKIVKAAQRAAIGKSGVGLAGSTISALADTAFQFSVDRNLALRGGLLRSRELTERGNIIFAGGQFASTVGKATKRASFISAGGSVLQTAGTLGVLSGGRIDTSSIASPALTNVGTSGRVGLGLSPFG